jgi:transglutaminase-like putative cysteine protease
LYMGAIPKGLLGAVILFWGYQTRLLPLAIPLALLLEVANFSRIRWDFTTSDFQRLWNGCLVLLLSAVVFSVGYSRTLLEASAGSTPADRTWNETMPLATRWALLFFQWQPLVFAPFVLAVAYGRQASIPSTVFAWLTRRQTRLPAASRLPEPPRQITVAPLYFALVLVAASTTNRRGWVFFSGIVVLTAWALWSLRSQRLSRPAWIAVFGLATLLGFGGQLGLNALQRMLVGLEANWLQRFAQSRVDALESRTSIGSIGRLKLSGKIVLRVNATNDMPPDLLREASYDTFNYSSWTVGGSNRKASLDWKPVSAEQSMSAWRVVPEGSVSERANVRIARFLRGGSGLLPLPLGTTRIENLPAGMLSKNNFGGIQVKDASSLISFNAYYALQSTSDRAADDDRDLAIPANERAIIEQLAAQLRLAEKVQEQPKEAMRAVYSYFRNRFRYTTYQEAAPSKLPDMTPLGNFLTVTRAGHCEYFATATALLLRAAGLKTRYAVGYSVQESAGNGNYLVRERHAHAWCMVWLKDSQSWTDFDTTPPSWNQLEADNASSWEPMTDFGSRLWFEYAQWKAGRSELSKYAVYGLSGLFGVFVLRVFSRTKRGIKDRSTKAGHLHVQRLGEDSEFFLIEKLLQRRGLVRSRDETAQAWIERILPHLGSQAQSLPGILRLHYRLRFDPNGLTESERRALKEQVEAWLKPTRM